MDFRAFLQQKEKEESPKVKPSWNPKREEVLRHWKSIPENRSIAIQPISKDHVGTSYLEDTVRLTGSMEFIDSVLSRLRDLLKYEAREDVNLKVLLRETRDRETGEPTGRYSCYIQVREK